MAIFQIKISDVFHISAQNIDCGSSLEPPRRGGSNEDPQSTFLSRNNKNNVHPFKPQFYYIKVGFKGVKIIQVCSRDVYVPQHKFYLEKRKLLCGYLLLSGAMSKTHKFCICIKSVGFYVSTCWLGGLVVSLLDFQAGYRGFESCSGLDNFQTIITPSSYSTCPGLRVKWTGRRLVTDSGTKCAWVIH